MSKLKLPVLSLLITFLLFFLSVRTPGSQNSLLVLKLDPAESDREIRALLDAAGISGYISESTESVFYDDFGELEEVPLDRYRDYIEVLDPRDDGYADKLREVFVDSGERRIFIPLAESFFGVSPSLLRKKLGRALAVRHTTEILGQRKPLFFPLCVFAVSAAVFFVLAKNKRRWFWVLLPALVFGLFGVSGFVMAALLLAFFELLSGPLEERFSRKLKRKKSGAPVTKRRLFFLFSLALVLALILARSETPLEAGIPAVFLSGLVFVFSVREEASGEKRLGHTRFIPLSIISEGGLTRGFPRFFFPFALGAVILALFPLFLGERIGYYKALDTRDYLDMNIEKNYEEHVNFQRSFSFRPLAREEDRDGYGAYSLGGDGLIARGPVRAYDELPPSLDRDAAANTVTERLFPRVSAVRGGSSASARLSYTDFFSLVFLILFALGTLIKHRAKSGKGGKNPLVRYFVDKRAAA